MTAHVWMRSAVLGCTILVIGTGCATKKHVRGVVAPLEGRIGQVEKQSADHTSTIGDLERGVSKVDEKAMDADRKAVAAGQQATQAGEQATRAGEQATRAGQRADEAHGIAEKNTARVGEVERSVANLDNYQLVTSHNALFNLNRSELSKDELAKLDEFGAKVAGMKRYIVEVQGYTDRSGNSAHNLELSRRRAQAVVRNLTVKHQVPLRRVQLLGVGSEAPTADNKTRAGRKQNRRVEIKVYSISDEKADSRTSETRSDSESN